MKRISWDQYFMAQSHLLALRSTCPRLTVGATIVRDKRIIAGGYNGSVSGSVHCMDDDCYMIDGHCVRTVHAEANAILQCAKFGAPTENAEIYVTHFPCLQCSKQIIQSGIKKVYYATNYKNHEYAIQLFKEAQVITKQVELDRDIAVVTNNEERLHFVEQLLNEIEQFTPQSKHISNLRLRAKSLFK